MDNGDTPDERALILARRQAERARLLEEVRGPDYDDDEPSVVTFKGEAAEIIARQQAGLIPRIQESLAPISRKMNSRGGKITAMVSLVVTVGLAVWQALRESGVFDAPKP